MNELIKSFYACAHYQLGGEEYKLSIVGGGFATIVLFWAVSGLFLLADVTGRPTWMRKYKIQLHQNEPPDTEKLKHMIKVVVFNVVVLNLLVAYPMFLGQQWAGVKFSIEDTPGIGGIIIDLIGAIIVQEIVFYYSHRLFHVPYFYKKFHKQHHQWTSPVAPVAVYAHPVEYLTGNLLSVYLGPLLMKSHVLSIWLWYSVGTIGTLVHHSGYHLPFLTSSEAHDYHHLKFNYNFGSIGILDWLHGTWFDGKSAENKRHRTIFGTRSAREIWPDKAGK